jgi:two-component system, cell cycle response regulator CtrA
MRILLIEDDPVVATSIELMLRSEDLKLQAVTAGEEGVQLGKLGEHDLILLDLNLPDMSGYDVLRSLRGARVKTPTLILSGLASIENKVKGLGYGADDYLTKPFHKDELVARIHAILRRSEARPDTLIRCGDLVINLEAQRASMGGKDIPLTNKEFQMLELMAVRHGSTITKEMFLTHLYGGMDEPEMKIIDVFICKLRRKLADASGGKQFIATVWGRGYTLREHVPQSIAV